MITPVVFPANLKQDDYTLADGFKCSLNCKNMGEKVNIEIDYATV